MENSQTAAKIAGIMGGMGPEATVDFMARVLAATDAATDQEHIHMLVDHNPRVPDPVSYTHLTLPTICSV